MGRPLADGRTETRAGLIITEADRQRFRRALRNARSESQIITDRNNAHPDGLKRCHKCGQSRPFHAFGRSTRERDGLSRRCYGCRNPEKNLD